VICKAGSVILGVLCIETLDLLFCDASVAECGVCLEASKIHTHKLCSVKVSYPVDIMGHLYLLKL
jgi:predicted short-subunit dehydrogenase-like oxidoreductase (DUF2520 family)